MEDTWISGSHDLARKLLELPDLEIAVADKSQHDERCRPRDENDVYFTRISNLPEVRRVSYLFDDSTDSVVILWPDDGNF